MDLFELRNNRASPTIHALLIEPYKTIWENDRSNYKENSIKIFTYIELLCSPKKSNPFYGYSEEERPSKVKKEVFKDENYEIDIELQLAILSYKEHLMMSSPSYGLCVSAENAADKLRIFLNDFDPASTTPAGSLKLKPRDITSALREIGDVVKSITTMRNKVHEELVEDAKTRSARTIGNYER